MDKHVGRGNAALLRSRLPLKRWGGAKKTVRWKTDSTPPTSVSERGHHLNTLSGGGKDQLSRDDV